jgi:hypothetical protein
MISHEIQVEHCEVAKTPAGDGLFNQGQGGKLSTDHTEIDHTFTMQKVYLFTMRETQYTPYNHCTCTDACMQSVTRLDLLDPSDSIYD